MSRLRVYCPEASERDEVPYGPEGEPMILSFCRASLSARGTKGIELLMRARSLYHNRRCPRCRHPVVEPIELKDAAIGRNRLPIPGTATLVGYHCARCDAEWPA